MDKIEQFVQATSTSRETAKRFLEASNYNVQEAIRSFQSKQPIEYYAGGEKSGVAIQGTDIVEDILKMAEQSGLGGSAAASIERELIFWKNGFSINEDGPLYEYSDPQNQRLLETIKSGQIPQALLNVPSGAEVDIKVSHRVDQEYIIKKPAFSGTGHRLGSIVPTASVPAAPATEHVPVTDPTKPKTKIQVRHANGTRSTVEFNLEQTVGDIYAFVSATVGGSFVLQTPVPVRVLEDRTMTIQDAKLANAVVAVRLVQ